MSENDLIDKLYDRAEDIGDDVEDFAAVQWKKLRVRWFCYGALAMLGADIIFRVVF